MCLPCLPVCIHHMHVFEAQGEECVCRRRKDYEWERCGGFASLQGGGEVDFFSHPFFMAFLLSDLQSLYIRLTGRFSFIFKHLSGTLCVCVRWWCLAGVVEVAWVKVEACCFSSSSNGYEDDDHLLMSSDF